jgi:hypothetical protein
VRRSRSAVAMGLRLSGEGWEGGIVKKLLEVMDLFIILTGRMVSWVYAYVKTSQIVYFNMFN